MKVLFWNIRGLGRVARRRQLKEFICTKGVHAVRVQETIKKDFSKRDLKNLVGDSFFR